MNKKILLFILLPLLLSAQTNKIAKPKTNSSSPTCFIEYGPETLSDELNTFIKKAKAEYVKILDYSPSERFMVFEYATKNNYESRFISVYDVLKHVIIDSRDINTILPVNLNYSPSNIEATPNDSKHFIFSKDESLLIFYGYGMEIYRTLDMTRPFHSFYLPDLIEKMEYSEGNNFTFVCTRGRFSDAVKVTKQYSLDSLSMLLISEDKRVEKYSSRENVVNKFEKGDYGIINIRVNDEPRFALMNKEEFINALSFITFGLDTTIIIGTANQITYIWDAKTGKELLTLPFMTKKYLYQNNSLITSNGRCVFLPHKLAFAKLIEFIANNDTTSDEPIVMSKYETNSDFQKRKEARKADKLNQEQKRRDYLLKNNVVVKDKAAKYICNPDNLGLLQQINGISKELLTDDYVYGAFDTTVTTDIRIQEFMVQQQFFIVKFPGFQNQASGSLNISKKNAEELEKNINDYKLRFNYSLRFNHSAYYLTQVNVVCSGNTKLSFTLSGLQGVDIIIPIWIKELVDKYGILPELDAPSYGAFNINDCN